jgi:probable rRNA maturation factor
LHASLGVWNLKFLWSLDVGAWRFNFMALEIFNRQRTKKINLRLLKQIMQALLVELKIAEAELGINLVAAREMILINETFLKHKGSTDVITFDYDNDAHGVTRPTLHGELFVCVDEAVSQAKKFKTSWQAEIVRYIVHGVLHLLGHDDLKPGLRRKMKREENLLLRKLFKKFSLAQIGGGSKLGA